RLADVVGHRVEVLDRDPGEGPERQAVGDDLVRALGVDVDLDQSRIAGDEDRVPERLEAALDGADVELAARRWRQHEHRLVAEGFLLEGGDPGGEGPRG